MDAIIKDCDSQVQIKYCRYYTGDSEILHGVQMTTLFALKKKVKTKTALPWSWCDEQPSWL